MTISEQAFQDFRAGRIDALYAEGFASLTAFAARCLTDAYAMVAEDCVQNSMLKAYQTRHTFASPHQLKSFLFVCVHNECVSVLRKTGSHADYVASQRVEHEEELSAAIIEQETHDLLHAAISELPEKYRQIFDLSYEKGLRHAEVARLLGITIDGVQKRRARLVSLLRNRFRGNS